ncbi:aminomethyl-transferring glycine dehydrogenase [Aestuariirhabdus sp. Z084]|uniref:aminomethyl-transferring glycine dehydrogenase n=1 Tax=Aestuariirhabdus haliotis TaxID=2918751 RepID=UPI00201B45E5|nr:aminomethyl-transferring glycine dehydrogenase [Aestuariirhabdus haliotis]MCL6415733.1 aminomethyl-transferring glycine dehydrogenase [Aestuariirhabdus haliotis]MCL6419741.1 aminomethyl-transferring glycine dehydrogenase [Aestuariirhabdus haliotis]
MNAPTLPRLAALIHSQAFSERHLGPDGSQIQQMLESLQLESVDALIDDTVPESIRLPGPLALAEGRSESDVLAYLKGLAAQNRVHKSYIGMGYYNTLVPNVILRNMLENPGWYTAYTPYQPEIAQGRLETLLNFQQMTMDLTGMDLANASLLDEATAAAEAMTLCKRANRKKSNLFLIADDVHPQTIDVVTTRAEFFGYEIMVGKVDQLLAEQDAFGVLLQYPATGGELSNIEPVIESAHASKTLVAVAADLLSLVLLKSPGEMGADVVFGSAQRFGVPMGFGGPHAAFFATRDSYKRSTPGRIIGQSIDANGKPALRMAMQTREQHIRREKATSNICTAQALLANMASSYAVYHGPEGLKRIAERVLRLSSILAVGIRSMGDTSGQLQVLNQSWFDTLSLQVSDAQALAERGYLQGINLRIIDDTRVGISLDETTTTDDVEQLWALLLGPDHGLELDAIDAAITAGQPDGIPASIRRTDAILSHPVFNRYHSETEMLRYLKRLENKDFSLAHGMIPLGSCTMKLNASAQMIPLSWPEMANIHPFAPRDQVTGYLQMIDELEAMLVEITGYDKVSMQPNSGAQGEYAGLLAIRNYQQSIGEGHRNICLIPSSAHGTNPASAAMAAMKVVLVECDEQGNVDVEDLRAKAETHSEDLSCLMVTYPSTHGVFEEEIIAICDIVHANGGQVYMDGANMNAQVGLSKPGLIGSDVSHLNLHKTFAIPHGGGGPGMGPIGVKSHLAPFLPNHAVSLIEGPDAGMGAIAAAPFGSASILAISWAYCALLGAEGLKRSTELAILSANYLTERLAPHYPILFRGRNGRVAHECIIDIRPLKDSSGISEEDIAKRLMDYGFHAPTMSFPVAGTLMIEPTESESKQELDRFIDAMIAIREEIALVESGHWTLEDNPLVRAPHTQGDLVSDWDRAYSREQAVFPVESLREGKFWPSSNRIDNVYGDRNFICGCPSIDSYRD